MGIMSIFLVTIISKYIKFKHYTFTVIMKTPPTKAVITISIVIILFFVIASITIPVVFIYFVQKENSTETGMSLNIALTSGRGCVRTGSLGSCEPMDFQNLCW